MAASVSVARPLFGAGRERLDIWHDSNAAEEGSLQCTLPAPFAFWDEEALEWAR